MKKSNKIKISFGINHEVTIRDEDFCKTGKIQLFGQEDFLIEHNWRVKSE